VLATYVALETGERRKGSGNELAPGRTLLSSPPSALHFHASGNDAASVVETMAGPPTDRMLLAHPCPRAARDLWNSGSAVKVGGPRACTLQPHPCRGGRQASVPQSISTSAGLGNSARRCMYVPLAGCVEASVLGGGRGGRVISSRPIDSAHLQQPTRLVYAKSFCVILPAEGTTRA
jgi:hypothetical protein